MDLEESSHREIVVEGFVRAGEVKSAAGWRVFIQLNFS